MVEETNSRELKAGGLSVIVRELNVQNVRTWLQDLAEKTSYDFVDEWLINDISVTDIKRMCTLKDEDIDQLTPTQLEAVAAVCKELNPHFFGLLAKARELGQSKA